MQLWKKKYTKIHQSPHRLWKTGLASCSHPLLSFLSSTLISLVYPSTSKVQVYCCCLGRWRETRTVHPILRCVCSSLFFHVTETFPDVPVSQGNVWPLSCSPRGFCGYSHAVLRRSKLYTYRNTKNSKCLPATFVKLRWILSLLWGCLDLSPASNPVINRKTADKGYLVSSFICKVTWKPIFILDLILSTSSISPQSS